MGGYKEKGKKNLYPEAFHKSQYKELSKELLTTNLLSGLNWSSTFPLSPR